MPNLRRTCNPWYVTWISEAHLGPQHRWPASAAVIMAGNAFTLCQVQPMRNPLQEQLLKAGLVKKSKVAEVVREQTKQRHGKGAPGPNAEQAEAERARQEKVERDRALAAERNAQAR